MPCWLAWLTRPRPIPTMRKKSILSLNYSTDLPCVSRARGWLLPISGADDRQTTQRRVGCLIFASVVRFLDFCGESLGISRTIRSRNFDDDVTMTMSAFAHVPHYFEYRILGGARWPKQRDWMKSMLQVVWRCRQVVAEVVSKSRNKIHQTWQKPFSQAL